MSTITIPDSQIPLLSTFTPSTSSSLITGLWSRTCVEEPILTIDDTTTYVRWLQPIGINNSLFCDIRLPYRDIDFSNIRSFKDCSIEHLKYLSKQKGFAGYIIVENKSQLVTCSWIRLLDFQPILKAPDVGYIFYNDADKTDMLEYGTDWDYKEYWSNLAPLQSNVNAKSYNCDGNRKAILCFYNEYVMLVVDRKTQLPESSKRTLLDLVDEKKPSNELWCEWLNFIVISGKIENGICTIERCTLPWLENTKFNIIKSGNGLKVEIDQSELIFNEVSN